LTKLDIADIFFAIFALIFLITRLALYPLVVIKPALMHSYHDDGSPYLNQHNGIFRKSIFGALFTLQALHIYWFYLIIMVAVRVVTKAGIKDVRDKPEDVEEDDDDDKED
jgi:hypothetical protein